jgi:hypothetical protein
MEHACTAHNDDQEDQSNSRIEYPRYCGVHPGVAYRTNEGKHHPQEVELGALAPDKEEHASQCYNGRVQACIRPASDRIDWGVLPCLQAIAMIEVVGGLPVVEDFVAVLDRGIEGC